MARKALLLLSASVAVLAASQWREISRYIKISQMSRGDGHPQVVPAAGQHAYPTGPGGAPDGTGDFDSASRGGPAPLLARDCEVFVIKKSRYKRRARWSTPSSP